MQWVRAVTVFVLAVCVWAQAPPRPNISEEFTALITFQSNDSNLITHGEGHWAHDQTAGKSVENFTVTVVAQKKTVHEVQLLRYDQKMEYQLEGTGNTSHCHKSKINGSLEPAFSWVLYAQYTGKKEMRQREYDEWSITVKNSTVKLLVDEEALNVPVIMTRINATGTLIMEFHEFKVGVPEAALFNVPPECEH